MSVGAAAASTAMAAAAAEHNALPASYTLTSVVFSAHLIASSHCFDAQILPTRMKFINVLYPTAEAAAAATAAAAAAAAAAAVAAAAGLHDNSGGRVTDRR